MNALQTATATQSLVALTPQDVAPAQAQIVTWCRARIIELSRELVEARQNIRTTQRLMLGSPKAWQNVAKRTIARMIYYAKIQAAVRAGYLIVPNFPAELIAVRVNSVNPRAIERDAWPNSINAAKPDLNLPHGVGRYVDETNPHTDKSWTRRIPDGKGGFKEENHRLTRVDSYDEAVDFPAALVKPVIIQATERAMSLRIFDQIGVAKGSDTVSLKRRRSDPIVVGRIIDGSRGFSWGSEEGRKYVTFFIAWWLDTSSI